MTTPKIHTPLCAALEINTKIKGAKISGILFTEFSLLELLWNPGKFFQGIFFSWNKKILENSVLEENCPGIFSKIISQKNIFPGIYSSGIFHSWNFPFLEFCPGTFCSWNLISRNFLVTGVSLLWVFSCIFNLPYVEHLTGSNRKVYHLWGCFLVCLDN